MLGAAEDSKANMDIAGFRLSEPQNSPHAYAIRTGHSIRLRLSSAYPVGLLSNACSATPVGTLRCEGGKDVHVRYRLPPPLRSSIRSLPLSLSLSCL